MPPVRPRLKRPSAPLVIALIALFVALGGPAQAGSLINGRDIKKGTVTSRQVKDHSLTAGDLATKAVRNLTATPNGSVTAAKLAENSVTTPALAPGSVLSGTVGDNSLTAADLASNSIGTDEIADNAVGQTEIRTNGVGSAEIADNTIDGGKVLDGTLSVRDVARVVGTFAWPVGDLTPDQCQVADVTITGNVDLAGAFIVASPRAFWPSELVYTVNGTNDPKAFKVQACNRKAAKVLAATYQFNFAVFGF